MAALTLLRRSAVTLLAYAVALQAGLSVLTVLPHGSFAADFAVICTSPAGPVPTEPAHPTDGACCLAAGCAAVGDLAREGAAIIPVVVVHVLAQSAGADAAPPLWPSERPRSSRAPPM